MLDVRDSRDNTTKALEAKMLTKDEAGRIASYSGKVKAIKSGHILCYFGSRHRQFREV
jgi:hypothetical protein